MTITLTILGWLTVIAAIVAWFHTQAKVWDRFDELVARHVIQVANLKAAHTEQIAELLAAHAQERAQANPDLESLIALIDRLCQRLQAPEQAIVEHAVAQVTTPMAQPPQLDDDEGWWAQQETKEQLAERAMTEETVG